MNVLILGAGGFIGSNLIEEIVQNHKDWHTTGVDISDKKITHLLGSKNFNFIKLNVLEESKKIEELVVDHDVILPLVAIANPSIYVTDPLRVFELDFESNLYVVKLCAKYHKRIIFPSTSEVYGMCEDQDGFKEHESNCVTGPICKQRWIYSCSKQMLDRVIYAYGERDDLNYTLFRPFNWVGPRLDDIGNKNKGSSRVLTQFLSNISCGENINIVGDGMQMRSFTYISDGISALIKIIENANECARKEIFNIGNPDNLVTIKHMAETVVNLCKENEILADKANKIKINYINADEYFGKSYQDVQRRFPSIQNAKDKLQWTPYVNFTETIRKTIDFYF